MEFIVPFKPQSAMRPNYSHKTGRPNQMFMPPKYRHWRDETNLWFEDWLYETDYQLIKELIYMDDEQKTPIRDENGNFKQDFYGYEVKLMFIVPKSKSGRPFPMGQQSSDIDNYAKAVVDMMFESQSFKNAGLNDKYIQSMILLKRCAVGDEETHIEVDLHQIKL